jgi:hypothetical protein
MDLLDLLDLHIACDGHSPCRPHCVQWRAVVVRNVVVVTGAWGRRSLALPRFPMFRVDFGGLSSLHLHHALYRRRPSLPLSLPAPSTIKLSLGRATYACSASSNATTRGPLPRPQPLQSFCPPHRPHPATAPPPEPAPATSPPTCLRLRHGQPSSPASRRMPA